MIDCLSGRLRVCMFVLLFDSVCVGFFRFIVCVLVCLCVCLLDCVFVVFVCLFVRG